MLPIRSWSRVPDAGEHNREKVRHAKEKEHRFVSGSVCGSCGQSVAGEVRTLGRGNIQLRNI